MFVAKISRWMYDFPLMFCSDCVRMYCFRDVAAYLWKWHVVHTPVAAAPLFATTTRVMWLVGEVLCKEPSVARVTDWCSALDQLSTYCLFVASVLRGCGWCIWTCDWSEPCRVCSAVAVQWFRLITDELDVRPAHKRILQKSSGVASMRHREAIASSCFSAN